MEESHLHGKGKIHTTKIKQSAWKESHVSNMQTQYFLLANGTGMCTIGCRADLYSKSAYNAYLVVAKWQPDSSFTKSRF